MLNTKQNNKSSVITRRDFLQVSSLGIFGIVLQPLKSLRDFLPEQMGRVAELKSTAFDRPSLSGDPVKIYWRDTILPITEVTVGDVEPRYNRIWYQIGDQGYVHSGAIQPVQTHLNQPTSDIPSAGVLAEVTVPYTDAHWGPGKYRCLQFFY